MKRKRIRVAQTIRPNRIGVRTGAVIKGVGVRDAAVRVIPQNFPQTFRQRLRVLRIAGVPNPHIQIAIRSKMDRPAVVDERAAQVVQVNQDFFAVRSSHIPVRRETTDAIVRGIAGDRVIHIHIRRRWKIGVERNSNQSAFGSTVHRERRKRGG